MDVTLFVRASAGTTKRSACSVIALGTGASGHGDSTHSAIFDSASASIASRRIDAWTASEAKAVYAVLSVQCPRACRLRTTSFQTASSGLPPERSLISLDNQ